MTQIALKYVVQIKSAQNWAKTMDLASYIKIES